jgi:hypothetical protein
MLEKSLVSVFNPSLGFLSKAKTMDETKGDP